VLRGETTVLTVGGIIDFMTGSALQKAVDGLIGGVTILIIDLSKVTFMSSIGLTVLASTQERIGDSAGKFAVVANSPATRRPIQLMALDGLFSMYSRLDEALMSLPGDVAIERGPRVSLIECVIDATLGNDS
jgi:anti-sigma B factor antagonist